VPPYDFFTCELLYRKRLAGEHGLIDGGGSADDEAVHRDAVSPGANGEDVVGCDLRDREVDIGAIANDVSDAGL